MTLADRVKQIRSRATIRRWGFRQRHLGHGAWDRFRTALAMARDAYAIDELTLQTLADEGFPSDRRGEKLEPPREIVWISPERAARLGAPALVVRLDAEMLASRHLALVGFPGIDPGIES